MENQHNTNVAKLAIELSPSQSIMAAELEWYKESGKKDDDMRHHGILSILSDKKDIHDDPLARLFNDMFARFHAISQACCFRTHNSSGRFAFSACCNPAQSKDQGTYNARLNLWRQLLHPRPKGHNFRRQLLHPRSKGHNFRRQLLHPRSKGHNFNIISLDQETVIRRLEFSRKRRHPESFVTIPMILGFWESDGHNFDIKSLDPTKMTQETYDTLVDIIEFVEISRLPELFLRAMILCFIALKIILSLMVESSDSKAKIQEIKAMIQDKFNYNGNCNVKIGIIPERSGTPFLKTGVLRPTPMFQKVHSTQLVLRLFGAKHISREYDITSIVSKLSTSEVIVLPRGF